MKSPLLPQRRWCITGVGGFIGSHLLESLLLLDHEVTGFDDFSSGHRRNLEEVRTRVSAGQWSRFRLCEGDVRCADDVASAIQGASVVLHHAALVSVPRSIADPRLAHEVNVTGFLNVLEASRAAGVERVVFASSSAVYGDSPDLPAREDRIGAPLSPYALSKRANEEYAAVHERCYGLVSVALRYFNVFGPRQDPAGAYAAVIPRWILAWLRDEPVVIHGDGGATRDFCPVERVVEANLRAAAALLPAGAPRVFNVGSGQSTSLNDLAGTVQRAVARRKPSATGNRPVHGPAREGDIRHSRADVAAARRWLDLGEGPAIADHLEGTVDWLEGGRGGVEPPRQDPGMDGPASPGPTPDPRRLRSTS